MAEAPAPRVNRPAAFIILVLLLLGTLAASIYGVWALLEENRADGLTYFSLAVGWFLFWSWRLRWALNPKPMP